MAHHGLGQNIRTMITPARAMETSAWIPSSRCSRDRSRASSDSASSGVAVASAATGRTS
jgi:hypothetical protein